MAILAASDLARERFLFAFGDCVAQTCADALYGAIEMTEERKFAILFAATILCARKLIDIIDSDKPNFAKGFFVDKAIEEVAFVLDASRQSHRLKPV